ncbi:MAG: hypothetical protein IKZ82_05390 [Clostridia bacterium]|nr:hypothetical protein [Clostridia bacterium]
MKKPLLKTISSAMRDKEGRLSFAAIALIGTCTVLVVAFIAFALVIPGLNKRQRRLEEERAAKQHELDELMLQKEFLQELSSLNESREFLIRYLRETQGYILKGDIRLDLTDPEAVIPTPVPSED